MSRFAHHAATHPTAAEFALVQTRYVAVPALLWGAAMVCAIAFTAIHATPADTAARAPVADDAVIAPYGA